MIKWAATLIIFLSLTTLFSPNAIAEFNHPELKWEVIETVHFLIHYHQNEENFARRTAQIAENLYQKLTSYIGYHPDKKIPVVIKNYNDETGGYTSIFANKIVIQAQSDPLRSSGSLSWVKEVMGHELTHYISFAAIDESIVPWRKAMANLTIPMWFIEGLAQYLGEEWHSLKDMTVGDQAREDKIMSEGELGAFYFFEGWGRMSGYYQSDSFIRYIFNTYGKDKIPKIFDNLREQPLLRLIGTIGTAGGALYPVPRFINFNQALKKTIGKDSLQLYKEWKDWVIGKYQKEKDKTVSFLKQPLIHFGERAQCPVFSPDGNYIAFISNKGYDFAIFDLYLFNLSTKRVKKLATGVNPYFSFSPDGNFIVYSKTKFYPPENRFLSDLYKIEISTSRVKRLTYGKRAFQPVFSPGGDRVLFVKKEGGNSNLHLLNLKKGETTFLTRDKDGFTQNFSPQFSPDGERVVLVRSVRGKKDLYLLTLEDKKLHPLTQDEAEDRNPFFSPDGEKVIFISTRPISQKVSQGTFNLWSLKLENGKLTGHTRVEGGIFDPAVSPDGKKIAFSGYKKGIFSIYLFPFQQIISQKFSPQEKKEQKKTTTSGKKEIIAQITPKKKPLNTKTYPYHPRLKLHYIFPWFSTTDAGSYLSMEFYASDALEKHTLLGQAYFSKNTQYEVLYANRSFTPTTWIDMYYTEERLTFGTKSYPVQSTGQAAGVYYPLSDKLLFEGLYSQKELNTYLFNPELEPVPWEGTIRAIKGQISYSNLKPVREPQTLPWGEQIRIGVEWSGEEIDSDLDYLTWDALVKKYWRTSPNTSFALKLAGRRIENKGKEQPHLIFSLEEGKDLRGYPQSFLDSIAGENLLLGSVEYRFRLKKRSGGSSSFYLDSIGGTLFFDGGATWKEKKKLEESNIYKDAGAELRLRMLPFGKYPLIMRLGVAWPFDYDERGKFFISVGGVF